jgi:glutathione peroxidase-family protein
MADIYSLRANDIDGKERSLSEFAGKVMLIVNVASNCEWTPQYKNLQTMYTRYRERGFEVLAFPTGSFGRQETGTDAEIKAFCTETYGVSFPLFSKVSVKGKDIHPLFAFLTEKDTNPQFSGKITQNFNKFLVSRKGAIVARFDSKDDPLGDKIPRTIGPALDH